MIQSNIPSLIPEMMDVVRMFDVEEMDFEHYFSFYNGKFTNVISVGDQFFDKEYQAEPQDDIEYKRYARRSAKLAMYEVLTELTKMQFPWGALTGIRPTKLAYLEQQEGRDFVSLFKQMGVCQENIDLTRSVLDAQKPYYAQACGQDLFVSLPFCPSKCEYCSFITAPISATKQYLDDYLTALCQEISQLPVLLKDLRSVYIGGGTPFVLECDELERVYSALQSILPPDIEYTVEAGRPDVFTKEKLLLSQKYGVNRICINPQTFHNKTLQAIGRKHTVEQMYEAYEMAKDMGFIVNCDLIAGLADETVEEFTFSVKEAIRMGFENITVHTLCLKSGAKLKENTHRLQVSDIDEMLSVSRQLLSEAGYEPYYMYRQKYQAGGGENVGWTKPGKACIYNIHVMEEISDNIAVGANAVSKRIFPDEGRIERFGTPKDLKTYLQKIDSLIKDRKDFYQD